MLLKRFLSLLAKISTSLIVILSAISCASPIKYVYVRPGELDLPPIEEVIPEEIMVIAHTDPEVIEEPQTVDDLLYNIAAYNSAYGFQKEYSSALEKYITRVFSIIGGGNHGIQD